MGRTVVVVGAGLIGQKRLAASRRLGLSVAGVFDTNAQLSSTVSHEYDAKCCDTSLEAVAIAGDRGIVIVATPHKDLSTIARMALNSGCHVLIEKPGALNLNEMEAIATEAQRSDRVVHVGYNHRFHPAIRALRAAVENQVLGSVLVIRGRYGHGGRIGYEKEWRFVPAISGGGELVDQGSHLIDLAGMLTSPHLTHRYSHISNKYWGGDVEDNVFLHLNDSNQAEIWLHASWTEWKNKFDFEVFCERGKLEVTGLGGSYGPETFTRYEMVDGLGPPVITSTQFPPGDDSWDLELKDFLGAIEGGAAQGADVQDAVNVHRIIDAAYRK